MRVLLGVGAVLAIIGAAAPARAGEGTLAVDVDPSLKVDVTQLHAAVARELGVAITSPAPGVARLSILAVGKTLVVRFVPTGGAPVLREVDLPPVPERIVNVAALLAGNLARDEAADVLALLPKKKESPPPVAPEKAAALATYSGEVAAFEQGASAYRDAVTSVIRLHHEEKKREKLAPIDRKLAPRTAALHKAREVAITRFEALLCAHEGEADFDAQAARARLAVLYAERQSDGGRATTEPACPARGPTPRPAAGQ